MCFGLLCPFRVIFLFSRSDKVVGIGYSLRKNMHLDFEDILLEIRMIQFAI